MINDSEHLPQPSSESGRDLDLLDVPMGGVAAYWLALKKLMGAKWSPKILQEEAAYTTEPFIRYLLETGPSALSEDHLRALSAARKDLLLREQRRKFGLMRVALLDMAHAENPRKTVARMTSLFASSPLTEERAFAMAQELVRLAGAKSEDRARYFNVDHKMKCDQLMVALLFYVIWTRREGKAGCQPFLDVIGSAFFRDGLALVIDGFEAPFVRERLDLHSQAILDEAGLKMDLCVELFLGIRNRLSYEDLHLAARAYIV